MYKTKKCPSSYSIICQGQIKDFIRALLLPKLPLKATITVTSLTYIVKKLSMEDFTLVKGLNYRMNIFILFQNLKNTKTMTFTDRAGCLRIIIASVAFGLGVNCPDVQNRIILCMKCYLNFLLSIVSHHCKNINMLKVKAIKSLLVMTIAHPRSFCFT